MQCFFSYAAQVNLYCQDRIATDRPDETEVATLVPKHYFQGEFGFGRINTNSETHTFVHPTALLKYGLSTTFELRLEENFITEHEATYQPTKNNTGIEPLQFGFKAAILEGKKIIPKTSLITHVAIPTFATKEFKADHIAPSFVFVMENDITKSIDVGYNLGAEWDGFSSNPEWLYTVSVGFDITKNLGGYVEAFGFAKNNEGSKNSADGGLYYFISNDIKVDCYAGFGISNKADDTFYGVGISFRFR